MGVSDQAARADVAAPTGDIGAGVAGVGDVGGVQHVANQSAHVAIVAAAHRAAGCDVGQVEVMVGVANQAADAVPTADHIARGTHIGERTPFVVADGAAVAAAVVIRGRAGHIAGGVRIAGGAVVAAHQATHVFGGGRHIAGGVGVGQPIATAVPLLAKQATHFIAREAGDGAVDVVHVVHGHQGAAGNAPGLAGPCDRVVDHPGIAHHAVFGIADHAAHAIATVAQGHRTIGHHDAGEAGVVVGVSRQGAHVVDVAPGDIGFLKPHVLQDGAIELREQTGVTTTRLKAQIGDGVAQARKAPRE